MTCEELHIIFDGPPGPEAGRFVEVETADGQSIRAGEWRQIGDYWHLVILRSPAPGAEAMREAEQGGEPAHSRWNEDGVDYCGGCGRWMPEGTGRVAFDGTVICKGRPEKAALPAREVPE